MKICYGQEEYICNTESDKWLLPTINTEFLQVNKKRLTKVEEPIQRRGIFSEWQTLNKIPKQDHVFYTNLFDLYNNSTKEACTLLLWTVTNYLFKGNPFLIFFDLPYLKLSIYTLCLKLKGKGEKCVYISSRENSLYEGLEVRASEELKEV